MSTERFFIDWFQSNLERFPNKTAFGFLDDRGGLQVSVTYQQLYDQSSCIADHLTNKCGLRPGDRVLLVYLPSLDFTIAFSACLLSGVIAVPVFPPNPYSDKMEKESRIFESIVNSSGAKNALTSSLYRNAVKVAEMKKFFTGTDVFSKLKWETTDDLIAQTAKRAKNGTIPKSFPRPKLTDVAFLQYTSGSTSEPKGVIISHESLNHNVVLLNQGLHGTVDTICVSWLPQYHDLGLIASNMSVIYHGCTMYMMSPFTFIKNPLVWIECLSRYKGQNAAAPDFAFALCARKLQERKRKKDAKPFNVDLSSVKYLNNAAEPIQASSIENFYTAFAEYGLKRGTVFTGYGLAEHTVLASINGTLRIVVDKHMLEHDRVVKVLAESDNTEPISAKETEVINTHGKTAVTTLLTVGAPLVKFDVDIRIVEPESQTELPEGRVGEIWITSPSKSRGYWGLPEKSALTFNCKISGRDTSDPQATFLTDKPPAACGYLATGDLGFLHRGELVVCGRMKDLIIIRGRNLYPQDIERSLESVSYQHSTVSGGGNNTVGSSGPYALRPGCSAAFSVPVADQEALVFIAEVNDNSRLAIQEGKAEATGFIDALRAEIRASHGVSVSAIQLLPPRSIPKTSSGKIARRWVRNSYLEGSLKVSVAWSDLDSATGEDEDASYLHLAHDERCFDSTTLTAAAVASKEASVGNTDLDEMIDPTGMEVAMVLVDLKRVVSKTIDNDAMDIPIRQSFRAMGLDSMQSVSLLCALEKRYSVRLPEEILQDPESTLTTIAASLSGGGSFNYRPIMVNGFDAWRIGMEEVEEDGPKDYKLLRKSFFQEYQIKGDVDDLNFPDGAALALRGEGATELTAADEKAVCIRLGFLFGAWMSVLPVAGVLLLLVPLKVALALLAVILGGIWYLFSKSGQALWSVDMLTVLRYFSYNIIIEAPVRDYQDVPSIFAFCPQRVFPFAALFQAVLNEYVVGESFVLVHKASILFTPVWRVLKTWWGIPSCDQKDSQQVLVSEKSVGVILGGASEMFVPVDYTEGAGSETLMVRENKSVVKLALQTGSQLVPCYNFCSRPPYTSCFSSITKSLSRFVGMPLLCLKGSHSIGAFSCFLLPAPNKCTMLTVIGRPLQCPKAEDPSAEMVHDYHEKFLREVRRIHDRYKNSINQPNRKLVFKR